jgi:hypothetical protein
MHVTRYCWPFQVFLWFIAILGLHRRAAACVADVFRHTQAGVFALLTPFRIAARPMPCSTGATGHLQDRLALLPTTRFSAESFDKDIQDVDATLMQICPNVPDMAVATFMDNRAGGVEKSVTLQQT